MGNIFCARSCMAGQRMCFVCVIVNRNRLIFQSMEQIGIGVKRVQRQGEVNLVMPQTDVYKRQTTVVAVTAALGIIIAILDFIIKWGLSFII